MDTIELIKLISKKLYEEAESCNDYAKRTYSPLKSNELYPRAGLLFTLSMVCDEVVKEMEKQGERL